MASQEELEAAFDKVSDPDDWRNPICAVVSEADVQLVQEAIIHFTGTFGNAERVLRGDHNTYKITAAGYRNGPCGP